jgi:hypothetical protein
MTTLRLGLFQAVAFAAITFAVFAILFYISVNTERQAVRLAAVSEYERLVDSYERGGMRLLNQEVIERTAARGALSYLLLDSDGAVIAGAYTTLPIDGELQARPSWLPIETAAEGKDAARRRSEAYVGRVLGGPILLVAPERQPDSSIARQIVPLVGWALLLIAIGAPALGVVAAVHAARRVRHLSEITDAATRGDLSRRAPVLRHGDEFDTLAGKLNAMLDQLWRRDQQTRTAGEAIAHDMRSPLTRLRNRLSTALSKPETAPGEDRKALQDAMEETDRLLNTFNAIFQLARLEQADSWPMKRVVLTGIVDALVELFEPVAEERGIVLKSSIARGLVINADAQLVNQALANLLDNAFKFTPDGGQIEVGLRSRADERVELRVVDSGPGIPVDQREAVKRRFVRLDQARNSPGVGLGLSLVAAVMETHKGQFILSDGYETREGAGLCATLLFPAAPRG